MASESNMGFHYDGMLVSALNQHISFQSGAINSSSCEMLPLGNYYGMNNNNTSGMIMPGNSNTICNSGMSQGGSPSGSSLLLDYASDTKQDAGLAVEWSIDEQIKLDDGLVKFAGEPSIMKYIKIAAILRDKTVRDVAMRCQWMTRKRRKQEEYTGGRKSAKGKDKLVESSSNTTLISDSPANMAAYSVSMHHMDQNLCLPLPYEAWDGTAKRRLEQNFQVFNQITANISTFKLQENIDLFSCTRNNITSVLKDMQDMPGIMSQMPPLPETINENLADSIMTDTFKTVMFGSPRDFQLKEEPRYR